MKLGLAMRFTESTIQPGALASAAEERGFESVFVADHTHIPVSRSTAFPTGESLPDEYRRLLDPFVSLMAAAATTTRLRLGTGVLNIAQRDPFSLAKQVATLDVLSGGRVELGVGVGWNQDELRNHRVEPSTRWQLLREQLEAVTAIWSQPEAEYHGTLINFDPIWSWPKPVQTPRPPVLLGGNGTKALHRALEIADGWLPASQLTGSALQQSTATVRKLANELGRPDFPITLQAGEPTRLAEYKEFGISRVLLRLPAAPADEVLPILDRYAGLT